MLEHYLISTENRQKKSWSWPKFWKRVRHVFKLGSKEEGQTDQQMLPMQQLWRASWRWWCATLNIHGFHLNSHWNLNDYRPRGLSLRCVQLNGCSGDDWYMRGWWQTETWFDLKRQRGGRGRLWKKLEILRLVKWNKMLKLKLFRKPLFKSKHCVCSKSVETNARKRERERQMRERERKGKKRGRGR